jgi:S-adenosylmethionine-diacylglycerol 3-amino-3-carboxypropyl transferase
MLRGTYRTAIVGGVPPYLDRAAHSATRERLDNLELVDGGYAEYLGTCDDDSVDGFALSNICEWLDGEQIHYLFSQIVRVARPGARVCFRNFVGHTEMPQAFRSTIVEDVEAGRAAIRRDRSCLQARFVTCRVEK